MTGLALALLAVALFVGDDGWSALLSLTNLIALAALLIPGKKREIVLG
jgi:hypothetical protein